MIDLNRISECSGCGACCSICPRDAITLAPDSSGFLYPKIDAAKCVDCNLCNRVCQMDFRSEKAPGPGDFYALVNKKKDHLKVSSSGGAFLAVAAYVFEQGGVVAGCGFDEALKATHILTYSLDECIQKLCGSKYVQSQTLDTFREVKGLLSSGRTVLYTGTPCQIEGLLLYLQGRPENLITMDLICHGVSSPLLWYKHKEYLQKQVRGTLDGYRFRSKEKPGSPPYFYRYTYAGGTKTKEGPSVLDPYYTDFLKGLNHRESCYQCRYTNLDRVGDITLGDAWGAKKFTQGLDIENGVSLIRINTPKGQQILQKIADSVTLVPVDKEAVLQDNHRLTAPTPRPPQRDRYYQQCFADFVGWEKAYTHTLAWGMSKLKSKIPTFIKRAFRR